MTMMGKKMKMGGVLGLVLGCLLAAGHVSAAASPASQGAGKPKVNVLLVVSDDLRPDIGCYGEDTVTPHMDALAQKKGSVTFDRAYVQQAICCPSRSSFLTGRRPDTTKVWDLDTYWRQAGGNFTTLPEVFRGNGYWTVGMGKVFHPGFHDDEPYSWSEPYYHPDDGGLGENMTNCYTPLKPPISDDDVEDGMVAQHAVGILKQAAKREDPFFVAVGFRRPHLPFNVPEQYFDLYPLSNISLASYHHPPKHYGDAKKWSWDPQSGPRHCGYMKNMTRGHPPAVGEYGLLPNWLALRFRRGYWASVSATDRNLGVVMDALEKTGKADNTIVVFFGDHGWHLGDNGEFGKKTNFERGTRTPLIVHVPLALQHEFPQLYGKDSGQHSNALVEFVDIMPSIMDLAGLSVPTICPHVSKNVALCSEGVSLRPALARPWASADFKDAVFMQYAHCMHDDFIWHDGCKNKSEPRVMGYAVRTRRWRYIEWVPINKTTFPPTIHWDKVLGVELYDHTEHDTIENVAESVNLAGTMPDVEHKLSTILHSGWRRAIPSSQRTA